MAKPKNPTEYLVVTLPWIIIIFGVIGNALSAAVVLRKRFRTKSLGVYILALAILDTIFLLSNTLIAWGIEIHFGVKIQSLSNAGCSFVKYIIVASRAMSAWILVVLTVERMLSLAIPHLSRSINTRRRAIISTVVIVILQGLLYTYSFKFSMLRPEWDNLCYWTAHVMTYRLDVVVNLFDFLNYSIAPSVIMATCNSVLIHLLHYSQDLRSKSGSDLRSIVVTVMAMSIAFILLTIPQTVYQILYVTGVDTGPLYVYPIVYSLDLLNHAINFLLYCVSGSSFRNELKIMFRCCTRCCPTRRKPTEGTDMTSVEARSTSAPSQVATSNGNLNSNLGQPSSLTEPKEVYVNPVAVEDRTSHEIS